MTDVDGLRAPLARRLRQILEAEDMRHEDLAEAMTGLGFDWNRNRVTQIVTGRGALSMLEVAGLCNALGRSLSDLLGGPQREVALPGGSVHFRAVLEALFYGKSDSWDLAGGRSAETEQLLGELGAAHAELMAGASTTPSQLTYSGTAWGEQAEATRKAARRLGVPPRAVEAAAMQLWGRSLTVERDHRVEPRPGEAARTLQARRAHATRALLAELSSHLGRVQRARPDQAVIPTTEDES